jgi:hypothetical protein
LLPISFLAPHIFIHVTAYFPRHIMIGYVAMAASVAYFVNAEMGRGAGSEGTLAPHADEASVRPASPG